jgi:hypothetical protein
MRSRRIPDEVRAASAEWRRERLLKAKGSAAHVRRLVEWDTFWRRFYPWIGGSLEGAVDEDEKVEVLSHFLRDNHKRHMRRGKDLGASLRAIRWRLQVEGRDEYALDSSRVQNTKRGGKRTTSERRVVAKVKGSAAKLPAGFLLLDDMWARLMGRVIDGGSIDDFMVYVASGVSLEALVRVGEISQPQGKTAKEKRDCDHMIRSGDVLYRLVPEGGDSEIVVSGIRACIPYLVECVSQGVGRPPLYVCHPERVRLMTLNLYTDKMGHDRYSKELGRETERASVFLDVTIRTLVLGNAPDDEGIFTRWTNRTRTGRNTGRPLRFVAERVRVAIKAAAERLGLDPALFSAHSWRKGGAAIMKTSGVPDKLIAMRGAWVEGSAVMNQVYTTPFTAPVGPMGAAAAGYDTAAELTGLRCSVAARRR